MNTIVTMWDLLILGQAAAGGEVSAASVNSIWDFVIKGGPMMIPIGICSLVALTITIERLVSLRRGQIIPSSFLPGLKKALDDDDVDRSNAIKYCRTNASPVANIFLAGIKKLGESVELMEKHIQEAGEREVLKLRKYLRSLSVIASIAPPWVCWEPYSE